MAITVNGDAHPWREGLTVAAILEEKKYSFPLKTVFIGTVRVPKDVYEKTLVEEGAEVRVIHLMGGG